METTYRWVDYKEWVAFKQWQDNHPISIKNMWSMRPFIADASKLSYEPTQAELANVDNPFKLSNAT